MRNPPRTMVALITPFDRDGSIDGFAHRSNLAALADRGLDGFLIGGSTGQGPYLEPGERAVLTATARSELGSAAFIITGVSAQSLRQTAPQIAEAAAAEADAVLVTTPTMLLRADQALVAAFFRGVADHSPLPVFCYSVPAVTGYELPVDVAVETAAHRNIVGFKDSGGDVTRVPRLAAIDDYYLFIGASRIVHEAMLNGAYGAITASANYTPELVTAARTNAEAQRRLLTITAAVERHGLAGTYAAAEMVGLNPGAMRAPLRELGADEREVMRKHCCPGAAR